MRNALLACLAVLAAGCAVTQAPALVSLSRLPGPDSTTAAARRTPASARVRVPASAREADITCGRLLGLRASTPIVTNPTTVRRLAALINALPPLPRADLTLPCPAPAPGRPQTTVLRFRTARHRLLATVTTWPQNDASPCFPTQIAPPGGRRALVLGVVAAPLKRILLAAHWLEPPARPHHANA